jgi:chaperonin cofactor prefoldin
LENQNKKINSFFKNNSKEETAINVLKKDLELLKNRVKLLEDTIKRIKK